MKRTLQLAAILLAISSMPSFAALQSVHWKANGDNLVTLDTQTGIEWLDLSQTDSMSYTQVSNLLSTTLKGWRFPTQAEVHTMMSAQFSQLANYSNTPYSVRTNTAEGVSLEMATGKEFREKFGSTYTYWQGNQDWQIASYGLFKENENTVMLSGFDRRNYWNGSFNRLYHNLTVATSNVATWSQSNSGWYLVSDGGLTLSSLQDPSINQNNPLAPNQPPRYTTALTVGEITQTSASINLGYNGSDYTGFTYKINGGALQYSQTGQITLTDLLAGTNYLIEYTAYNANGTSTQWGQQLITTAVADVPAAALGGLASLMLLMRLRRRA